MTLYEIDSQIMALVDPETGEVADLEELEALSMARDQKLENMACWIKNMKADSAGIAEEIKALQERKKAVDARRERISKLLQDALAGQKFESARCVVSFRKTPPAVEIDDVRATADWLASAGYDDCLKYRDPEIKKTELRELINGGTVVPGCRVVQRQSMTIK